MALVRNILGTFAGLVAAQAVVFGTEWLGTVLYPPPDDIGAYDAAQIADWIAGQPLSAKLLVVSGWALGAFAGPWLALRITDRPWAGWIVTAVFFAGSVTSLLGFPHPLSMEIGGVVLPPLSGWLAQRTHRKPYPGEALFG